jgi:hypothetical protein
MAGGTRKSALFCPATVTVHNHRDMARQLRALAQFALHELVVFGLLVWVRLKK